LGHLERRNTKSKKGNNEKIIFLFWLEEKYLCTIVSSHESERKIVYGKLFSFSFILAWLGVNVKLTRSAFILRS
jgi:hypothetical protein